MAGGVRLGRHALVLFTMTLAVSIVAPLASANATPTLVRDARMVPPPLPPGAVSSGPLATNRPLRVEVVLPPGHPQQLAAFLRQLYQKGSPTFHQWLAPGEFARRFAPDPTSVASVQRWLADRGLRTTTVSGFDVIVTAPAGSMAAAFGVTFRDYRLPGRREAFEADGPPLLPASVATLVSGVVGLETVTSVTTDHIVRAVEGASPSGSSPPTPGRSSPRARPLAVAGTRPLAEAPSPCPVASSFAQNGGALTPDQAGAAYGIDGLIGAGQDGTGQTVAVYEVAPHIQSDVNSYESCFGLHNPVTTALVDGGGTPDAGGSIEADLDIEQFATQAPGASIISYEGPNTAMGALDTWNAIVNQDTATVISASVGLCEPDASVGGFLPQDTPLQQAAAQGQTVLVASGDAGSESCFDDTVGPNTNSTALEASFPASDPWVTAVGGTYLTPGGDTVWNDCQGQSGALCSFSQGTGATGGGLSRYEPKQPWQTGTYQWTLHTNACATSCRNVPDVSANAGVPEVFFVQPPSGPPTWGELIGTSMSTPMVAGLVADTATGCASNRKGDIAPLLYGLAAQNGYGTALTDVTSGNNDFTDTYGGAQFPAGPGYDPASGLGTPLAQGWSCPEVQSLSPAQGPAGTAVTVTGLGLEGATILFGATAATVTSANATSATVVVPAGGGTVTVRASSSLGQGTSTASFSYPDPGHLLAAADGGVFAFNAPFEGSLGGTRLNAPIVGMAVDHLTGGYWLVASDGGVFAFDAPFEGSLGGTRLNAPIVGMVSAPLGVGYWLVASDGGVFAFNAPFEGSLGGTRLNAPIVGMAVDSITGGYWLVAADGGVFAYNAPFEGSLGAISLRAPIVGMASAPLGVGYRLVASDGGVFAFNAPFAGSLGGTNLAAPVVGIATDPATGGYWVVDAQGVIYSFDAPDVGSLAGTSLNSPVVAMAVS